jgi:hypothetical protein
LKRFMPVIIGGAALAALAGPRGPLGGFWAPAPAAPHPHGALLAGFLAESLVENAAFGAGLAVLLLGRGWFAARAASPARATAAWLATVWLLASWMPHAALHMHIGLRPGPLLPVEWIFHGGAILAIGALLWALSSPLGRLTAAAAPEVERLSR